MVKFCPNCGNINEDSSKFCINCGNKFPTDFEELNNGEFDSSDLNNDILKEKENFPDGEVANLSNCPICEKRSFYHLEKKSFLGTKKTYLCTECGLKFEKKASKYKLLDLNNKNLNIWLNYNGQTLTKEEWIRIANGGLSNQDQKKKDEEIAKENANILAINKENDIKFFVNSLLTDEEPLPIVQDSPIILKKGEIVFLVLQAITLMEPRAVRVSNAGYSGSTIRVAKGVSFRVGGGRAQSESHDELRNIDKGTLIISNKRFIFTGSTKNVNVNLNKIIAITEYRDGISIQRENKQKVEYFTGTDQTYCYFTHDGRRQETPFYGYMIKALIQGRISLLE